MKVYRCCALDKLALHMYKCHEEGAYITPVLGWSQEHCIPNIKGPDNKQVHHSLVDALDAVAKHEHKRQQQAGHCDPRPCQIYLHISHRWGQVLTSESAYPQSAPLSSQELPQRDRLAMGRRLT